MHQRNLFLRISTGHRYHRCPDILGTGMSAQSARKKSISVRYLEDVRTICAISRESSRQTFGPHRQIFARVAYYRRFSRSTRRSVDADNLTHRHGTKSERIIIPQIIFRGEGQLHDVVYTVDVVGSDVQFLHFLAVERRVVIHPLYRFLQPDPLQSPHALPIHAFDAFIPNFVVFHNVFHVV